MEHSPDITAFSHGELVALVYRLRQQLEERHQQIARLKQHLLEEQSQNAQDVADRSGNKETTPSDDAQQPAEEVRHPGSQEGLLSQLRKIYPGGE